MTHNPQPSKTSAPNPPQKKRVAAYTRVATTSDASYLENLSSAISCYSAQIQSNPAWAYAGVYADDTTGTKAIRAEFNRMLADARSGKIDLILTDSISRFGQTSAIMLEAVRELQSLGVAVRFEEQGIDTLSGDSEQVLSLLAACADMELLAFSAQMKAKRRAAFARGEGGFRPAYGYDLVNQTLVPNEQQATVVRRVFEDYLNGKSPQVIMAELVREGVPSAKGGGWTAMTVARMLTNERYAGHCLLQKMFTVDPKTQKVAVNRGELPMYFAENTHPAIISQDVFDKARAMFRARGDLFRITPADGDFALSPEDENELRVALENSNVGLHKIYGYDYANGVLTPNKEQAGIVRRLFDEYNSGASPYVLADNLERARVPSMFGGKWTAGTVSKILTNVRYAGHRLVQKRLSRTGELMTHFAMNAHTPIVRQAVFDQAQEMRRLRRDVFRAEGADLFDNVNGELRALFGFDCVEGAFLPNKAKSDVVQRIFDAYNAGDSTVTIARGLNHDGVLTASGGRWHKQAIANLLKNPFYSSVVGEDAADGARQMTAIRAIVYARDERGRQAGTPELRAIARAFERGKMRLRPIFGFDYSNLELG